MRCCHSTWSLLFRGFPGVAGGGGFSSSLRVHLLGIDLNQAYKTCLRVYLDVLGLILRVMLGLLSRLFHNDTFRNAPTHTPAGGFQRGAGGSWIGEATLKFL